MRIDPAPFWSNLYLYNYESKYITNLIKTNKLRGRRFLSTFRLIDNIRALNDSCKSGMVFLEIYQKKPRIKSGI